MKQESRSQLKRILSSADENFLVALANKGLVRRAQKDLESGELSIEETDAELIVHGPDWTVWMPPAGPAKARDDTKASGVTRQILAATIYLRDHWCQSDDAASQEAATGNALPAVVESEKHAGHGTALALIKEDSHELSRVLGPALKQALLDLTPELLGKWAGKKLLSETLAFIDDAIELEVEEHLGLTLRFRQHDIEVRALPSKEKGAALLDHLLSTAPKSFHKRWVLTAVLALKRKEGMTFTAPDDAHPEKVESPRTRGRVLNDASRVISGMLATGIAHPSASMLERLSTLSMSASAVRLPRLAHMLRTLAEDVSLMISRDATADTQRMFASMCFIYALVKALAAAEPALPKELAGVARTQYDPAGTLKLTGVGAYPWQTASGYEGLTVLFWEADKQRFLTWTASRPAHVARRFDVAQIYRLEPPWAGGGAPERICRSSFVLGNARVNAVGRLSSGQEAKATADTPSQTANQVDFGSRLFCNWTELSTYAASQFPIGLKLPNPLGRIVVVQPRHWGERFFDEMQQALCWQVQDDDGHSLLVTLPWNDTNETAIEFLEAVKPERDKLKRLVARIVFSGVGFALEPISLISEGTASGAQLLNPAFDRNLIESRQSGLLAALRQKYKLDVIKTSMTSEEEWEDTLYISSIDSTVPSTLRNALSEAEGFLLQIAESGTRLLNARQKERMAELSRRASRCGLTELSQSLIDSGDKTAASDRILWSGYLCRLHWQAMTQLKVG